MEEINLVAEESKFVEKMFSVFFFCLFCSFFYCK